MEKKEAARRRGQWEASGTAGTSVQSTAGALADWLTGGLSGGLTG
jgi:hypothetical protein